MPVLMVAQLLSGISTPMESMPVWLQYHHADDQPDAAFRRLRPGRAVPRRRHHARMATAGCHAVIGAVYSRYRMIRFRKVIFGG